MSRNIDVLNEQKSFRDYKKISSVIVTIFYKSLTRANRNSIIAKYTSESISVETVNS